MEGGSNSTTGVAGSRHENGRPPVRGVRQTLHAGGEETRTEILEGRRRAMEQFEQELPATVARRQIENFDREVERVRANLRHTGCQFAAGKERLQKTLGYFR